MDKPGANINTITERGKAAEEAYIKQVEAEKTEQAKNGK